MKTGTKGHVYDVSWTDGTCMSRCTRCGMIVVKARGVGRRVYAASGSEILGKHIPLCIEKPAPCSRCGGTGRENDGGVP